LSISNEIAEGMGKAFAGAILGFIAAFLISRHPSLSLAAGAVGGLLYSFSKLPWFLRCMMLGAGAAACFYYGDGDRSYNGLLVFLGWVLVVLCIAAWHSRPQGIDGY